MLDRYLLTAPILHNPSPLLDQASDSTSHVLRRHDHKCAHQLACSTACSAAGLLEGTLQPVTVLQQSDKLLQGSDRELLPSFSSGSFSPHPLQHVLRCCAA